MGCVAGEGMRLHPTGSHGARRGGAAAGAALVGIVALALAALVRRAVAVPRLRQPPLAGVPGGTGSVGPPGPLPPSRPRAPHEPDAGDAVPSELHWRGLAVLLAVAAVTTASALSTYFWLNHRLWPVRLHASASASTRNVAILQDLRLVAAGKGSNVYWVADSGYVRQLIVSGSGAEVIVPLLPSQCHAAATALGAKCVVKKGNPILQTLDPVTFTWPSFQHFGSTTSHKVASASLDISPFVAGPVLGADVTAAANARPSYCFTFQPGVTLIMRSGARTFTRSEHAMECFPVANGLRVQVGPAGSGLPPTVEFSEVEYLHVQAQAPAGILYGFAGQLDLRPGGTTVAGNPSFLCSMHAPCDLSAVFTISNATQSVDVGATKATSVVTNGGQLVPSAWAQNTDRFVPLFGFIFTILVITPLGAVLKVITDALTRWQGPRQRRADGQGS